MVHEKRLIDANAVDYENIMCSQSQLLWLNTIIEKQPTVDAVEVVRCKNCKHWQYIGDGTGDCTNARFHLDGHPDPTMKMDDFCSCGERRGNGC